MSGLSDIIKKPRMIIWLALLLLSLSALLFNGLLFGVDFEGGTIFQIELEESVSTTQMDTITSIVSQRLDAFGLSDTKVNPLGDDLIAAQIAETDVKKIEQLENILKTQARFEALIDGQLLFKGSDIKQIFQDGANGFGVSQEGDARFTWRLPFLLSQEAAASFSKGVFHRCTSIGFDPSTGSSYDCDSTYFFIDRPDDGVIILPTAVYTVDNELLFKGNPSENIPVQLDVETLMGNSDVPYLIADSNFTATQLDNLAELKKTKKKALVHSSAPAELRTQLESLGFKVVEIKSDKDEVPWIWSAVGARQVISITPGIANLEPYVENVQNAAIFSQLNITGSSTSAEEATQELKSLQILLETGSLPIGIKSISKQTISPLLGSEFLSTTLLIGFIALIIVSLVLFLRYRKIKLAAPMVIVALSEIVIIAGTLSFMSYRLDLAAVTGILAVVGTGVDDQIVITDELLRGEASAGGSFVNRVKKAFFIIFAAAATTIVTMLPIILFGFGFGKLVGFALTTILGVLIGVFVTRPAFSIIAEYLLKDEN
ncbi:MAG: hypothetical protein COV47_06110 [Candidatus Diapherotrites archaeon CG11_big_fil_rev_8_21_14_0_20_37_9]|nr:MAG: hypothetical protein COV47_06110 [Candidatus Diapherotrites archaeon CG11_big_fil_rev_8_21_14_0_20_37_9]